jgi:sigma-70-like protein
MVRPRARYAFRGQMLTAYEIAEILGETPAFVRKRVRDGIPIDLPHRRTRCKPSAEPRPPRKASGHATASNVTDDALYTDEDPAAQYIERYFAEGEPLHSAQEIAELLECSLDDATTYREQLRREMFGGRPTLEVVGELHGVSRERVRQAQEHALEKLRKQPRSRAMVLEMRDDVATLQVMRKAM